MSESSPMKDPHAGASTDPGHTGRTGRTENPRRREVPWRPPTRRTFVAMLGAAAAAFAATPRVHPLAARKEPEATQRHSTAAETTRWIGHC
jgi:hypothetical protein